MSWFRIDDGFADHPKLEGLEGDAVRHAIAVAAWTLMGVDCSKRRTDGHFTEARLRRVLPWPEELVVQARDALLSKECGLWERVSETSLFHHDWEDYQPTKAELAEERKAATERQKRWRQKRREMRDSSPSSTGGGGEGGGVDASTNASTNASRNGSRDASGDGVSRRDARRGTPASSVDAPVDATPTRPVPTQLTSPLVSSPSAQVQEVFDLWRKVMSKEGAKLDPKRKRIIERAIRDYGFEDAKAAVIGCSRSNFHMGREPDSKNGKKYNEISLIFRDAEHTEPFIADGRPAITTNGHKPPPGPPDLEALKARIEAKNAAIRNGELVQ